MASRTLSLPTPLTSSIHKPSFPGAPRLSPAGGESAPPWQLYAEGVKVIARRRLGDASLADDVAQESITRAITTLASHRDAPVADLGAFVYGIARHIIADIQRGAPRTVPLEAVAEPEEPRRDALDLAIRNEERSQVRAAIQSLSADEQDLVRLLFVEGSSAEEIARRTGATAVSIRKRKSRLLERLRGLIRGGHKTPPASTDS